MKKSNVKNSKVVHFVYDREHDGFTMYGIGEYAPGGIVNRVSLDKNELDTLVTEFPFDREMFKGFTEITALFVSQRQPGLVGHHCGSGTYVVYGKNNDGQDIMFTTDLMQVAFYVLQNGTVDGMFEFHK